MITHRSVRQSLYDYLRGGLPQEAQQRVAGHVASCEGCRAEMEDLKSALEMVELHTSRPSDEQPEEFWKAFPFQVEERVKQGNYGKRQSLPSFMAKLIALNRRAVIFGGSALALGAICLIALVMFRSHPPEQSVAGVEPQQPNLQGNGYVEPASLRLHQYLRKSKVLFIGIANMNTEKEGAVDLSSERKASRDLIEEARYLQSQPLDRRSERLIGDMEKILIELANMKEQNELPNVEMIRGGIHQENLLFKIRMAESMYDTSAAVQGSNF
jgi:hypothetical protein